VFLTEIVFLIIFFIAGMVIAGAQRLQRRYKRSNRAAEN